MLLGFFCVLCLDKFSGSLGIGIEVLELSRVVEKLLWSDVGKAPGRDAGFGCPS